MYPMIEELAGVWEKSSEEFGLKMETFKNKISMVIEKVVAQQLSSCFHKKNIIFIDQDLGSLNTKAVWVTMVNDLPLAAYQG